MIKQVNGQHQIQTYLDTLLNEWYIFVVQNSAISKLQGDDSGIVVSTAMHHPDNHEIYDFAEKYAIKTLKGIHLLL